MTIIQSVLGFLLAIGPLIIFHELGHYSIARLCGVKVLRFSLGMGKIVWSRRFGADQTEWALSALPIGGYVKMLDNRDPETAAKTEEDAKREFTRASVWRRIAIVAAGPIANFILAILVFAGLYMHGIPDVATKVRFMPETSPAYLAGLRGGERITAVNGTPVANWTDLHFEILDTALDQGELRLDVTPPEGAAFTATVPAATVATLNLDSDIMGPLGLVPAYSAAMIGEAVEGGPGQRAGLRAGDLLTHVDGKAVRDQIEARQFIRAAEGRAVSVTVSRSGQALTLAVTPQLEPRTKTPQILVKFASAPEMVTTPAGLLEAGTKAVRTTVDQAKMMGRMLWKIATLQLSWKNISGPITIADYAGQTASAGAIEFLRFIAVISISLGVMNLLPIPVLDGGLLLYYSLEVLTGRPLPERIVEYLQRIGVGLLFMLMTLAVFNDVVRRV
ncbi:MAG: RIP metalloprotease RseP [Pseudomonadota bacterium]